MIATESEKLINQQMFDTKEEVDKRIQAQSKVMSLMESEINSSVDNKILIFEK
jgi:hypothetical protein